jgi:ribosomal protein S18 acetylase RimI-like enzyme
MTEIEVLEPVDIDAALPALAEILQSCVQAGASVGFVLPFTIEAALGFWQGLLPAFRSGERRLLVARRDGRIAGTVQLVLAGMPNGRHRAEIAKLLVDPARRRQGAARALMLAAEVAARRCGRSLLVLDTVTDGVAESLYLDLGFVSVGRVPSYALSTAGVLETTHILYKLLPEG